MNAKFIEYTDDEHETFLNAIYDIVSICGYKKEQGTILRQCDYIAFRESLRNFESDKWICTECDTIYDNQEDAEDCCKEDNNEEYHHEYL